MHIELKVSVTFLETCVYAVQLGGRLLRSPYPTEPYTQGGKLEAEGHPAQARPTFGVGPGAVA